MDEYTSIIKDIKSYIKLEKASGVDELMLGSIIKHSDNKESFLAGFDQEKKVILDDLKNKALECKECALCNSRRNLIFGEGNPDAELMFMGEAPGLQEDIQGKLFVGKAGVLLTKIIEAMGLKREDVYFANCLKCRPPHNRNPLPSEIVACREFFMKQIQIIKPKVICCLGKFASQTVLMSDESITKLRGNFFDFESRKVMPTFHPAYLLRNPQEKRLVWEDMKKIRDYLKE